MTWQNKFVAGNISNLSPLSLNNMDFINLLQEIEDMKSNKKLIANGQSEMAVLVYSKHDPNQNGKENTDPEVHVLCGGRQTCQSEKLILKPKL